MARRARLNVVGGVFHLVSRFVRDERLLDRPGARDAYLESLGAAARTSGVEVLAYCLMSNHVHLVVVQGERPLERFMKSLHGGFAAWVHRAPASRSRKAQGPVFAERARAVLVDKDAYLLEVVRYVHNNPVRADVARFARSSTWSSHQAYVARVDAPEWLSVGLVLSRFGKGRVAAKRFDAFVDEGRKQPRRPELSGIASRAEIAQVRDALGDGHRLSDGVLGSEAFATRVRRNSERSITALSRRGTERRAGAIGRPTLQHLVDATLLHCQVDPIELSERPKSNKSARVKRLVTWLWVHEYEGKQVDVARALRLDRTVVSHHYRQAVRYAGDYDQEATAITAIIRKHSRRSSTKKLTPPAQDAARVRYHVDADETDA